MQRSCLAGQARAMNQVTPCRGDLSGWNGTGRLGSGSIRTNTEDPRGGPSALRYGAGSSSSRDGGVVASGNGLMFSW